MTINTADEFHVIFFSALLKPECKCFFGKLGIRRRLLFVPAFGNSEKIETYLLFTYSRKVHRNKKQMVIMVQQ